MINNILKDRPTKVFVAIACFFAANALIANVIGSKLFSLERVLGMDVHPFTFLGQEGLTYTLTCGVILWPLEFILTDVVNEFYGPKAVRRISYTAIALIAYAFLMFFLTIYIPADEGYWTGSKKDMGIPDMQVAFKGIFGQGMLIIVASMTAFFVSQLLDVHIFHLIKKVTGEKHVWLRATGSTLISQLVDSFIVLFIAFVADWGWQRVIAVGLINYSYKLVMAVILTPVIYWMEARMTNYFGKETAAKMKRAAMGEENV